MGLLASSSLLPTKARVVLSANNQVPQPPGYSLGAGTHGATQQHDLLCTKGNCSVDLREKQSTAFISQELS